MRSMRTDLLGYVDPTLTGLAGSTSLCSSTSGNSSVVEHNLAKVGVAGSNPVSRSKA